MNLLDMRDHLLALPALENRLLLLESEIQEAEKDLAKLLSRYKRENRNVQRLEKESFSTLLIRLTGKLETRLEETKREEINAKLAYDNAAMHLSNLTQEKQELASRIAPLKAEEKTFTREMERRRTQITRQLNEPQGIRYTELENERTILIPQITKLKEALRVTTNVISTTQKIAVSLDNARGAIHDSSAGVASRITSRHDHLIEAEETFQTLSSQLRDFRLMIKNVPDLQTPSLNEVLSTQLNIQFVFSFVPTSFPVRDQIRNKSQEVNQFLSNLRDVEAELELKLQEQEEKYRQNIRNEEELLLSI